eukprot:TRINITY_DN2691_c0_g1_i1.p1 TRINITY_DN2691_c0_g1~~TRINITY_DN2691_c0_g1_i1.p1  ORF type:complete len:162 (+),score=29.48 TRINITY_DN2691_c0_g1_i1:1-486(+)
MDFTPVDKIQRGLRVQVDQIRLLLATEHHALLPDALANISLLNDPDDAILDPLLSRLALELLDGNELRLLAVGQDGACRPGTTLTFVTAVESAEIKTGKESDCTLIPGDVLLVANDFKQHDDSTSLLCWSVTTDSDDNLPIVFSYQRADDQTTALAHYFNA